MRSVVVILSSIPSFGLLFFLIYPRDPQWQITYTHYRTVNMNSDLTLDVGIDFTMAIYNPNFIGASANSLTAQLFHEDYNGVVRHFGVLKMEPFSLPPRGHSLVKSNATIDGMGAAVGVAVLKDLAVNEGIVKMSFKTETTIHVLGLAPAMVDADCTEWVRGDRLPMRILQSECAFKYGVSLASMLPSFQPFQKLRPTYLLKRRKGSEQIYTGGPVLQLPADQPPEHLIIGG